MRRPYALYGATGAILTVAYVPGLSERLFRGSESGCGLQRAFGLECPGCGMTHAIVDLMHGRFVSASSHNALVWIVLGVIATGWLSRSERTFRLVSLIAGRRAGWGVLMATIAFTVLRNVK